MHARTAGLVAASVFALTGAGVVAPSAHAATQWIGGNLSCSSTEVMYISGWVNSGQTVTFYTNDRPQGTQYTSTIFALKTSTRSGSWEVNGKDLATASASCVPRNVNPVAPRG